MIPFIHLRMRSAIGSIAACSRSSKAIMTGSFVSVLRSIGPMAPTFPGLVVELIEELLGLLIERSDLEDGLQALDAAPQAPDGGAQLPVLRLELIFPSGAGGGLSFQIRDATALPRYDRGKAVDL